MLGRLLEKTKNAPNKPRRFESPSRFCPSRPFLQLRPVKENQEIEVVVDDIESRGDGVARIQEYVTLVRAARWGNEADLGFEVRVKNPPSRKELSRLKG